MEWPDQGRPQGSALAVGITRGFLAVSAIALAGLVITVITIRIRRDGLNELLSWGTGRRRDTSAAD